MDEKWKRDSFIYYKIYEMLPFGGETLHPFDIDEFWATNYQP